MIDAGLEYLALWWADGLACLAPGAAVLMLFGVYLRGLWASWRTKREEGA